jgi:hypothetical protein
MAPEYRVAVQTAAQDSFPGRSLPRPAPRKETKRIRQPAAALRMFSRTAPALATSRSIIRSP